MRPNENAQNITDVRISQIMDLVDIPKYESISKYDLEPSKILERKVYEKGDFMIRKFILWKTNKSETEEYPEYVIYNMDYSKNRQDPLKRDMKITNNEEQSRKLFDMIINSEMIGTSGSIKRGWREYQY